MLPLPRFEIRRGRFGRRRWRFVLISDNGEIVCTSEHYNSLAATKIGISAVRTAAPLAEVFEV